MSDVLSVMYYRLRMLFLYYPTEPVELYLATSLIGWGGILMLPPSSFSLNASYASFLATGIPELAWGAFGVAVGATLLVSMLLRAEPLRTISTAVTGLFFGFVAASMLISNSSSTGISTYSLLALTGAGLYLRRTQR